jgi:hypothetical protein
MGLRAESNSAARTKCVTFEVATRIEWFGKFKKLIHAPDAMEKPHDMSASRVKADIGPYGR